MGFPGFSSKKAYLQLIGSRPCSPIFKWMWKSCARSKHKFFFWLLLRDWLNTRNLLRRKNMHLDDHSCVLCSSGDEETLMHLFFYCSFSQSCCATLGISWVLSLPPLHMIIQARQDFGRSIFREIIIVASWCIWCHRNSIIFDNGSISLARWKEEFRNELALVSLRARPVVKLSLDKWMSSSL